MQLHKNTQFHAVIFTAGHYFALVNN